MTTFIQMPDPRALDRSQPAAFVICTEDHGVTYWVRTGKRKVQARNAMDMHDRIDSHNFANGHAFTAPEHIRQKFAESLRAPNIDTSWSGGESA